MLKPSLVNAVNAALTGHLVVSTLHTNDAATALPRLTDMGVEPFLVASTVHAIIAQRLVRKIHSVCRVSEEVNLDTLQKYVDGKIIQKIFGKQKKVRLYKGKGCSLCHQTGYEGRIGMFEVMVMDDDIREAVNEAVKKSQEVAARKLSQMGGGLKGLLGGMG